MSLISAWTLGAVPQLKRYHLTLRWTVFAGHQKDVSLAPLDRNRLKVVLANDPLAPAEGTYRLAKAPRLRHLSAGWYSVVGQAFLYGPHCSKSGCSGVIRQNRFHIK